MPSADAEHLFMLLPEMAAESARAAAHAARAWLAESVRAAAARPPETAGLLVLARAQMKLQMELERRGKEVVFFFIKKDLPTTQPARAGISITVQPEAEPAPGAATFARRDDLASAAATSYTLATPWFALRPAEVASPQTFAPVGAPLDQVVFLRLDPAGERLLGVRLGPKDRRRMRLTSGREHVDIAAQDGRWPVAQMLAVVNALRRYQEEGQSREGPLALPAMIARNDAHVVLDFTAAACFRAVTAVAGERRPVAPGAAPLRCPCGHGEHECPYTEPLPPELEEICPWYEVGDFEADITLRLNAEGRLASSSEAAVALGLHVRIDPTDRGKVAHLALEAPDFLKRGPWREALLARAASNGDLADDLNGDDHGAWDLFFEGARAGAVVFRSALRGDRDETDVLALAHQGRTVLAWVDVRRKEEAELDLEIRDASIFHDSRRAASETLAEDDAERFFSLFSQLQSWLSLL